MVDLVSSSMMSALQSSAVPKAATKPEPTALDLSADSTAGDKGDPSAGLVFSAPSKTGFSSTESFIAVAEAKEADLKTKPAPEGPPIGGSTASGGDVFIRPRNSAAISRMNELLGQLSDIASGEETVSASTADSEVANVLDEATTDTTNESVSNGGDSADSSSGQGSSGTDSDTGSGTGDTGTGTDPGSDTGSDTGTSGPGNGKGNGHGYGLEKKK